MLAARGGDERARSRCRFDLIQAVLQRVEELAVEAVLGVAEIEHEHVIYKGQGRHLKDSSSGRRQGRWIRSVRRKRPRPQHVRVMAGNDRDAGIPQLPKTIHRAALRGEVIGEGWKPLVVQRGAEVANVRAQDQMLAHHHRLVPGRVARRQHQRERTVAEQIVLAVHEHEIAVLEHPVIARIEEVASHGRLVVSPLPLAPLENDRYRARQQRQPARMIEVQMCQHHPGDRAQIDLRGDIRLQLQLEEPGFGALVVALRVRHRGWVQAGVDQDALALGLQKIRRDRKADSRVGILALAPDGRRGGDPADVEHLDLHGAPLEVVAGRLADGFPKTPPASNLEAQSMTKGASSRRPRRRAPTRGAHRCKAEST